MHERRGFVSVPSMPPSTATARARRARRERQRATTRTARYVGIVLLALVALATLLMTAFSVRPPAVQPSLGAALRLAGDGRPAPQIVAARGALRLQLPVTQTAVTAVGYAQGAPGAIALDPVGRLGNEGLVGRVKRSIFGGGDADLLYFKLAGDATSSLAVGAAPGTDVYSPVDGTIVGVSDYVLDNRRYGVRIDIQPTNAPSLVVSLTHLRADPALSVGYAVAAGTTKIGTVIDLSRVERQTLARYTQDAGNHVTLEVRPAATLTLP